MASRKRNSKLWASALVVSFSLSPTMMAMAGDDFASGWQPKPLVDTSIATPASGSNSTASNKPAAPVQPELEAKLKPAEPFIQNIETKLYIKPKTGTSLVERLNTVQTVLFGEAKYQDAGELLAKLAEIFPTEAAQAQLQLNDQLKNIMPYSAFPQKSSNPPAATSPGSNITTPQPSTGYYPPPAMANSQPAPQTSPAKKKKSFWSSDWGDDFDDDFKNDPFFQDTPTTTSSQQGPSKLGAVGQGLAGLALMAGGIVGNQYLNKKLGGGNNVYPDNRYYNGPYGPNPNYPYNNGTYNPYGAYPYGTPYGGYPYGAPQYYGPARGYAPQPYFNSPPGTITYKPYLPYSN